MSTVQVSPLVAQIFDASAPRRSLGLLGWSVALAAHVLAASVAFSETRVAPRPAAPLEVELAAPEPPPPPPAPTAPPEEAQPAERAPAPKAAAAAPQPARVGALLTAKADPAPSPGNDEPVDFTNDPSLIGFGSGVVAIGGKAQVGLKNAQPAGVPASTGSQGTGARPSGDALVPAADLSKKPSLGEADPCRGFFPSTAVDDVATAAVLVTLARSGAVSSVRLLSESPSGQGFGAAARSCMSGKQFSPGLDRDGKPVATAIRVNIRFAR